MDLFDFYLETLLHWSEDPARCKIVQDFTEEKLLWDIGDSLTDQFAIGHDFNLTTMAMLSTAATRFKILADSLSALNAKITFRSHRSGTKFDSDQMRRVVSSETSTTAGQTVTVTCVLEISIQENGQEERIICPALVYTV